MKSSSHVATHHVFEVMSLAFSQAQKIGVNDSLTYPTLKRLPSPINTIMGVQRDNKSHFWKRNTTLHEGILNMYMDVPK